VAGRAGYKDSARTELGGVASLILGAYAASKKSSTSDSSSRRREASLTIAYSTSASWQNGTPASTRGEAVPPTINRPTGARTRKAHTWAPVSSREI